MNAQPQTLPDWAPNIAVIGKMGAGKSTLADLLIEHWGYRRLSFAAKLREVAVSIWGESARNDRAKLQGLGVAVREIDEDAWVNAAMQTMQNYRRGLHLVGADSDEVMRDMERPMRFVIDDCRFPNEYQVLREQGFVFVQIEADETVRIDRLQRNGKLTDVSQLNHVSETALDGYSADYKIVNNESDTFDLLEAARGVIYKEVGAR